MSKYLKLRKKGLEVFFLILFVFVAFMSVCDLFQKVVIDHGKKLFQGDNDLSICSDTMDEYLKRIESNSELTTVIVVKDIQGFFTSNNTINQMKHMGFDLAEGLQDKSYHSFIGIWSKGEVVYQQLGGDEVISYGQFINNHYVYSVSATCDYGNTGEVYIDDIQYAVNNRGFNIVTFDACAGELVDSVSYDVYLEDIPMFRIKDGNVEMVTLKR